MTTTTAEERWAEQSAAEIANEPQWIVWTDLVDEAEWAAAELAVYGAGLFELPGH